MDALREPPARAAAAATTPVATVALSTSKPASKADLKVAKKQKKQKKKRRLKVAPRFYAPTAYPHTSQEHVDANVALLRDVFTTATCRCFILKSFSDANFHKSLKYGLWTSTYAHNAVLDAVFQSEFSALRPVLLFFSVCGSKHFNGIARMTSRVRTDLKFPLWEKSNKYDGLFHVEWLLVKDVPNFVLTDIKMSNTPTKKSITACRDCEEVMYEEVRPSTHVPSLWWRLSTLS
jgi:YTH domain-containing family protein